MFTEKWAQFGCIMAKRQHSFFKPSVVIRINAYSFFIFSDKDEQTLSNQKKKLADSIEKTNCICREHYNIFFHYILGIYNTLEWKDTSVRKEQNTSKCGQLRTNHTFTISHNVQLSSHILTFYSAFNPGGRIQDRKLKVTETLHKSITKPKL